MPVHLKEPKAVSSASLHSPHDPEATYSAHKGKGYEVQVAETCHADNAVEVITHVAVTDACASDAQATLPTIEALAGRGLQPEELVADTTYGSGDNAVAAAALGTELVSPVGGRPALVDDVAPAARPLTLADFHVAPRADEPARCPAGHVSTAQVQSEASPHRRGVTFDRQTCEACAWFHRCPARLNPDQDGYGLTVDLVAANLERRRRAEASGEFKERYAIRAGIEATHSELKRRPGLGSLRVRGRPRVGVAVYVKALACNLKRMVRALRPEPGARGPAMA